jgi:hypothetical protein
MWFARFTAGLAVEWARAQGAALYLAEDGPEACAYLQQRPALPVPAGVTLVRLQLLQDLAGASAGAPADWHYVVATDVMPEQEADFNLGYRTEHLPGLAAVPGTARAARYRVSEGEGPRYHAGYDLADRAAFNSPPWLAVRATPWSARVRPAFLNTRRTMYRRVR